MDVDAQIRVRFVPKLNAPFRAPPFDISISTYSTPLQLSDIVNNRLKAQIPDREWESQPFIFLSHGKLVRTDFSQFLPDEGIYVFEEDTLEIEYFLPSEEDRKPYRHGGCVGAVDGSFSQFILTGCHDGFGRVWNTDGVCTHILEGHTGVINSVRVIDRPGHDVTLATASSDGTLGLWKMDSERLENSPAKIKPFKIMRGCKPIMSVAAQISGSMICSGSCDSTVKLWQIDGFDSKPIKKRRTQYGDEESQLEGEPLSTLEGHVGPVSSVAWPEDNTIYSASWDTSIKKWDAETCRCVSTYFCARHFNCLSVGASNLSLVAAGVSDGKIRIFDQKKPGKSAFKLSSHNGPVTACVWRGTDELLSASHDGRVMLWDLRTLRPFSIIELHEHHVLCADWWEGDRVISGGADRMLRISSRVPRALKEG